MSFIFSENCYNNYYKNNFFSTALDGSDAIEDTPIYAKLGEGNSIDIIEDRYRVIRKIISIFSSQHNSDLFAVNQRLKTLYAQVMASQGPDFEKLKNEIKDAGSSQKLFKLSKNLLILESAFKKGNHESFISSVTRKIINCFRQLFQFTPLRPIHYEEIDINTFILKLKGESNLSLDISGPHIPQVFTLENLKNLQHNKPSICFEYGLSTIQIYYSKLDQCYKMHFKNRYYDTFYDISNKIIELKDNDLGVLAFTITTKDLQQEPNKKIIIDVQSEGW
jgi:hypothetical protein